MHASQISLGAGTAALLVGSKFVAAGPATRPGSSTTLINSRDDNSEWHTTVEIGSSQWHIGDAIPEHFKDNYMKQICSSTGCDGGTSMSFKYLTKTDSSSSLGEATITMTGNSDNNIAVVDQMLDAVSTALVGSMDCEYDVKAKHCMNQPGHDDVTWTKRETPSIALDCGEITFNSCYLANYIQATMYDAEGDQKAQVTFNGASEDPKGMTCSDFLDPINAALEAMGPLDIAGVEGVSAATSVVSAICGGS